jgi:hypothetical protein
VSGETSADEFGPQHLGVSGPIQAIRRIGLREDIQRTAAGSFAVSLKDPWGTRRPRVAGLVVGYLTGRAFDGIDDGIQAGGFLDLTPDREMPAIRRPADRADESFASARRPVLAYGLPPWSGISRRP